MNVDTWTGFQLGSIWLVELSPPVQWFRCVLERTFYLKWVNNFTGKFVTLHAPVWLLSSEHKCVSAGFLHLKSWTVVATETTTLGGKR